MRPLIAKNRYEATWLPVFFSHGEAIPSRVAAESPVQCVANVHGVLGEGPVWVARETALYWVDIKGRKILRVDAHGQLTEWPTPFRVGSLAPRRSGGFIGGTEDGIAAMNPQSEKFDILFNPEESLPGNRFNDGKLDRQGRFWAGTMDDSEKAATGTLYVVDSSLSCRAVDTGYRVTNGPAFSPDGKLMYHSDSARQVTYVFDLNADGTATNRRELLKFKEGEGYPDGMTVDAEGCLWVCLWDGWAVRRYSPQGDWLETVKMPVQRPTSCTFGGRDLDRLYISSASKDLDDDARKMQPNAGALFMITPGVRGLADVPFAG
jgi:sugar lactone lactonase YvrE